LINDIPWQVVINLSINPSFASIPLLEKTFTQIKMWLWWWAPRSDKGEEIAVIMVRFDKEKGSDGSYLTLRRRRRW